MNASRVTEWGLLGSRKWYSAHICSSRLDHTYGLLADWARCGVGGLLSWEVLDSKPSLAFDTAHSV
jgi:hypothetical protein